jgi:hypothetical protein
MSLCGVCGNSGNVIGNGNRLENGKWIEQAKLSLSLQASKTPVELPRID